MIQIYRLWQHLDDPGVLHVVLSKNEHRCELRLRRETIPELYDFLMENGSVASDTRASPPPN